MRRPLIHITFPAPSQTMARTVAGGGVFALTLIVLWMIYTKPDLAEQQLFSMLAQAIIIQGLIGLVMAFLFTGKGDGREATGKSDDPVHTQEEN